MSRKYRQWVFVLAVTALLVSFFHSPTYASRIGKWSVLDVGTGDRPDPRKHHTMVYDAANNRVILYGGENQSIDPNYPFSDLWVLNLGSSPSWQEITNATGDFPPGLHGHSAAYDAANGRMLMLAGRVDFGTPSSSSFADGVWELDWSSGYVWDKLFTYPTNSIKACPQDPGSCAQPFAKRNHSAAACVSGNLYLMGGRAGTGAIAMHDVWMHPASGSPNWSYVSGSIIGIASSCESCIDFTVPNLRYWHTMIADGFGRLVIFGGFYEDQAVNNAWYSTDGGTTWSFLGNAPSSPHSFSREFHTAVFDSEDDRMVVVGGYIRVQNEATITGAVTSLPLPQTLPSLNAPNDVNNNWVLHGTCGLAPGPIAEHAAVYDAGGDRVLVFGGVTTNEAMRNNDVWVLTFDADVTAPAAVTLSAGQIGRYASTITWTAPGDDGNSPGTACEYDLRRSSSTITEGNFYSATRLTTDPPQLQGSSECASTGSVSQCQTYYYALRTIDDQGNISGMSNVLSIKQKCSGASYMCPGLAPIAAPAVPQMVDFAIRSSNPAGSTTTLFVGIPSDRQGESMELSIFDVTGARVRTLVQQGASAGEREIAWDHRTDAGTPVAGGIYFARLRLGNETRTHKIVIPIGR